MYISKGGQCGFQGHLGSWEQHKLWNGIRTNWNRTKKFLFIYLFYLLFFPFFCLLLHLVNKIFFVLAQLSVSFPQALKVVEKEITITKFHYAKRPLVLLLLFLIYFLVCLLLFFHICWNIIWTILLSPGDFAK